MRPRLASKDRVCEYLGDISEETLRRWRKLGIVPSPIDGTSLYDLKAIDHRLDEISNLPTESPADDDELMKRAEQWGQKSR